MSYFPDCRTDEFYNEKYLNEKDAKFLRGYDFAVETVVTLLSNLDVYPDFAELLEDKKAIIEEGKIEIAEESIKDWMEGKRDELISSMIDGMSEEEYNKIKAKVDADENV